MNYVDYGCRMGELEPWIDENFVKSVWFGMGEHVSVKMIRDKFSGYWFLLPVCRVLLTDRSKECGILFRRLY